MVELFVDYIVWNCQALVLLWNSQASAHYVSWNGEALCQLYFVSLNGQAICRLYHMEWSSPLPIIYYGMVKPLLIMLG